MRIKNRFKKLTAYAVSVCMITMGAGPVKLHAQTLAPAAQVLRTPDSLRKFTLPEELGRVQEHHHTNKKRKIYVIEDAHGIPSAQESIAGLISYLRETESLDLVGVEGTSGKLDTLLWKAFPEKVLLRRVMNEYSERGEIAGAALAALRDESGFDHYFGVEEMAIYEANIDAYLRAEESRETDLEEYARFHERVGALKKKYYSPALQTWDALKASFDEGEEELPAYLSKLSDFAAKQNLDVRISDFPLLESITALGQPMSEEMKLSIQRELRYIGDILRRSIGDNESRSEFFSRKQAFETEKTTAEEYLEFLIGFAEKKNISLNPSPRLLKRYTRYLILKGMDANALMRSLKAYEDKIQDWLIWSTDQYEPIQRMSRFLSLSRKMIRLEMSRKEWEELSEILLLEVPMTMKADYAPLFRDIKAFAENISGRDSVYTQFYHFAREREEAMLENLERLMEENHWQTAAVVAGGFHSRGMLELLREKEADYVLIRPEVSELPKDNLYAKHMKGDLSWKSYFKNRAGRVSNYDAFTQYTVDKLMDIYGEESAYGEPGMMLDLWRANLLRSLAREGRSFKAPGYTRFLDRVLFSQMTVDQQAARRTEWDARAEAFLSKTESLTADGNLKAEDLTALFETRNAAAWGPSMTFSPNLTVPAKWVSPEKKAAGVLPEDTPARVSKAVGEKPLMPERGRAWAIAKAAAGSLKYGIFAIPNAAFRAEKDASPKRSDMRDDAGKSEGVDFREKRITELREDLRSLPRGMQVSVQAILDQEARSFKKRNERLLREEIVAALKNENYKLQKGTGNDIYIRRSDLRRGRDREGWGLAGGRLTAFEEEYKLFLEISLQDTGFSVEEADLLSSALVRIRRESAESRPELFKDQAEVEKVLAYQEDFDLPAFSESVRNEAVRYENQIDKKGKRLFSERAVTRLLYKKLIPLSKIESLMEEGLSKGMAVNIVDRWSDSDGAWKEKLKPARDELVESGLPPSEAIRLVIAWSNPTLTWDETLKPLRDELMASGVSRSTATKMVLIWSNPKETWEEVRPVRDELVDGGLNKTQATKIVLVWSDPKETWDEVLKPVRDQLVEAGLNKTDATSIVTSWSNPKEYWESVLRPIRDELIAAGLPPGYAVKALIAWSSPKKRWEEELKPVRDELIEDGVAPSRATKVVMTWSNPKEKWEKELRPARDELIQTGLSRTSATTIVTVWSNPKEKWEKELRPIRDELVGEGLSLTDATTIVTSWSNPKEEWETVLSPVRDELTEAGLNTTEALRILTRWSNPKEAWEKVLRPVRDELVEDGLSRSVATRVLMNWANPKEQWHDVLRPLRDELTEGGLSRHQATIVVTGWSHPMEKLEAVTEMLPAIQDTLSMTESQSRRYLFVNSVETLEKNLQTEHGLSAEETAGLLTPLRKYEEKYYTDKRSDLRERNRTPSFAEELFIEPAGAPGDTRVRRSDLRDDMFRALFLESEAVPSRIPPEIKEKILSLIPAPVLKDAGYPDEKQIVWEAGTRQLNEDERSGKLVLTVISKGKDARNTAVLSFKLWDGDRPNDKPLAVMPLITRFDEGGKKTLWIGVGRIQNFSEARAEYPTYYRDAAFPWWFEKILKPFAQELEFDAIEIWQGPIQTSQFQALGFTQSRQEGNSVVMIHPLEKEPEAQKRLRESVFYGEDLTPEVREVLLGLIPAAVKAHLKSMGIEEDQLGWDFGKVKISPSGNAPYLIYVQRDRAERTLLLALVPDNWKIFSSARDSALVYAAFQDIGDGNLGILRHGKLEQLSMRDYPGYDANPFVDWVTNELDLFSQRLGFKTQYIEAVRVPRESLETLGFEDIRPFAKRKVPAPFRSDLREALPDILSALALDEAPGSMPAQTFVSAADYLNSFGFENFSGLFRDEAADIRYPALMAAGAAANKRILTRLSAEREVKSEHPAYEEDASAFTAAVRDGILERMETYLRDNPQAGLSYSFAYRLPESGEVRENLLTYFKRIEEARLRFGDRLKADFRVLVSGSEMQSEDAGLQDFMRRVNQSRVAKVIRFDHFSGQADLRDFLRRNPQALVYGIKPLKEILRDYESRWVRSELASDRLLPVVYLFSDYLSEESRRRLDAALLKEMADKVSFVRYNGTSLELVTDLTLRIMYEMEASEMIGSMA